MAEKRIALSKIIQKRIAGLMQQQETAKQELNALLTVIVQQNSDSSDGTYRFEEKDTPQGKGVSLEFLILNEESKAATGIAASTVKNKARKGCKQTK